MHIHSALPPPRRQRPRGAVRQGPDVAEFAELQHLMRQEVEADPTRKRWCQARIVFNKSAFRKTNRTTALSMSMNFTSSSENQSIQQ